MRPIIDRLGTGRQRRIDGGGALHTINPNDKRIEVIGGVTSKQAAIRGPGRVVIPGFPPCGPQVHAVGLELPHLVRDPDQRLGKDGRNRRRLNGQHHNQHLYCTHISFKLITGWEDHSSRRTHGAMANLTDNLFLRVELGNHMAF